MRRNTAPGILAAAMLVTVPAAAQGSIELTVTGISPGAGTLMVAVHGDDQSFKGDAAPFSKQRVPVTGARMQIALGDLPPGTYAVSVYQDVNDNGELDRSFFGAPKEPFGFSNNAMGRRGPPEFSAAAIQVTGANVPHAIELVDYRKRRR